MRLSVNLPISVHKMSPTQAVVIYYYDIVPMEIYIPYKWSCGPSTDNQLLSLSKQLSELNCMTKLFLTQLNYGRSIIRKSYIISVRAHLVVHISPWPITGTDRNRDSTKPLSSYQVHPAHYSVKLIKYTNGLNLFICLWASTNIEALRLGLHNYISWYRRLSWKGKVWQSLVPLERMIIWCRQCIPRNMNLKIFWYICQRYSRETDWICSDNIVAFSEIIHIWRVSDGNYDVLEG